MNVSVADQSREAHLSTEIREYNRSISVPGIGGQEVARFSVYTVPSVSFAGQTVNPIGESSRDELVSRVLGSTGGVDNVQSEGNRTVTALGEDRTISRYSAESDGDQGSVNVTLHLATMGHEGDFVAVVAAHPEDLDEQERVDQLIEGLEHESDSDS